MENEKSVLITGASGGIGLAIAEAVAKVRSIL
jgi:3-oxoacyl-[acyl-carrier protein] reductase